MKDIDKVKTYIGIDIEYEYGKNNILTLSKKLYIESLAKRYNIENSKLFKTPMEINLKLEKSDINEDIKYSIYRFQNSYYEMHFKYVLRFLKYVYSTRELKLKYCKSNNADILDCFVDADWAGDIVDRKSTTGFFIRFFGNSISWKSKKQNSVTKSSTFAEYIALSEAVTEVNFKLFKQGNIEVVKIESENNIAVYLQKH
ncbi:unnamed protein product [Euphydryas editha]|uniref:RNase H type-1 domain-containing protein n=1 Tax=Euphydryas editha TaxID=104508 RepID=A0AAU9VG60_EUPED|nr:unnamed protein product [Euphydryas editha]